MAWCLYWPFYARRQDVRTIQAEVADTYNICLQQKGLSASDCATDRAAYTQLKRRLVAPPDQNAYQTFAGRKLSDALSFFTVLCLFPVLIGYLLVRTVLEAFLWFARARPQDAVTNR